ncbi:hypothetical protein MHBO_003727, partial [Bonamia ostreae]
IMKNLNIFNEFCLMLTSICNNCQINLMVKLPNYQDWINNIAKFTATAFNIHNASTNGIHYLLMLWSKFSSSIIYFRNKTPEFLRDFVPQITIEFMNANLSHLANQIKENTDFDSLLNEVEMTSIFQFLPSLFHSDYENSINWVKKKFDGHFAQLQSVLNGSVRPNSTNNNQLQIIEVEMAWIVYVVAAIISGDVAFTVTQSKNKKLDAAISSLPLKIVPYTILRSKNMFENGLEATPLLERALLCFFKNFQKSHIQIYIYKPILDPVDKDLD